ncbi:hypothetical protein MP213Fo_24180 [Pseudochrobactrum sp. MP213Fo]
MPPVMVYVFFKAKSGILMSFAALLQQRGCLRHGAVSASGDWTSFFIMPKP